MALVTGYDSDSDGEGEVGGGSSMSLSQAKAQSAGLKLPPPTAPSAPKSGSKRRPEKRQIRIDALDARRGEDREESTGKRTKLEGVGGGDGDSGGSSSAGLHGLLGMLPAPKQTGLPAPSKEKEGERASVNAMGVSGDSQSRLQLDSSGVDAKKAKGNSDFRAMLGLKPSSLPAKAKASPPRFSSPGVNSKPESSAGDKETSIPDALAASRDATASSDFFSLSKAPQVSSLADPKPAFAVSTAPVIEGEEAEEEERARKSAAEVQEQLYKGWQQGPDGQWFPVTPEAHAAYNEYIATQAKQQDHLANRPADMQYTDADAVGVVNANDGRQAWLSRPSTEMDAASSGLDRKYAMAAASMAMPDQGVPLVDMEEEMKKMDKKTNFRAKRKGQLSSLVAQAEENRERLEERWGKGKDGRNTAKAKYGF